MIKAIFFDIDGTLISKQKPLVQENVIQGLQQLRESRDSALYCLW